MIYEKTPLVKHSEYREECNWKSVVYASDSEEEISGSEYEKKLHENMIYYDTAGERDRNTLTDITMKRPKLITILQGSLNCYINMQIMHNLKNNFWYISK